MHEDTPSDQARSQAEGGLRRWGGNEFLGSELTRNLGNDSENNSISKENLFTDPGPEQQGPPPGGTEEGYELRIDQHGTHSPRTHTQNQAHSPHSHSEQHIPTNKSILRRNKHDHGVDKASGSSSSSSSKRRTADPRLFIETDVDGDLRRRSSGSRDKKQKKQMKHQRFSYPYGPSDPYNFSHGDPYGLADRFMEGMTDDARTLDTYTATYLSYDDVSGKPCQCHANNCYNRNMWPTSSHGDRISVVGAG